MQYFNEINEQVHEIMSSANPEPERALEFLKKLEEFSSKIDRATIIKAKSDSIQPESKSRESTA